MLKIEINKKEYNIPNKWSEMTIEYYCGLYAIIKKYQITEEQENSENDLSKFFISQENKMYEELFVYMTGISKSVMKKVPMQDVTAIIRCLDEIMEEYKPKGIDFFELDNETYYFPVDFIKSGTFI